MAKNFLKRLGDSIRMDREIDDDAYFQDDPYFDDEPSEIPIHDARDEQPIQQEEVGELAVDVFHTADSIYVKAMTAGVRKADLEIVITREMISISGVRRENMNIPDQDYFYRELYWGAFARTIQLPTEIDIESYHASSENGLLVIKLSKVDKHRAARVKIA